MENSNKIQLLNSPTPKKVLIVEDNSINAFLLERILGNLNFETKIAENGKDGYELTLEYQPDLVLMDLNMPILNGYDSSKLIRSSSEHINKVPIFAVTAEFGDDVPNKVRDAGMNEYIPKPINVADLEIYILKYLL